MLVAFGGAPAWTLAPAVAALAVSAVWLRPAVGARGTRALDVALGCAVAWPLLQLVPLPPAWRELLSPHAGAIDLALRFDGGALRSRPLSIDSAATLRAAIVAATAVGMFWTAREVCARNGVRSLLRAVAWTGLPLVVLSVVLLAWVPGRIYGIWDPGTPAAQPYGPFVNRNHMATWLVMALPLLTGYVFARFQDRGGFGGLATALDARMVWLIGAAGAMLVGIVVSLSRSAVVATLAAGLFGALVAARRSGPARWGMLLVAAAAIGIVMSNPRAVDLGRRFENSRTTPTWGRLQIWRETVPIVRDFALTGAGAGSYGTAMLVYQQSDRKLFFNQAHNHYLQLAAEGGILLMLPLACAGVLFAAAAARRLRGERSPMMWIRAGACAGIIAALVQSLWETGLRLPANGLLFAVLCAIAVHGRESGTAAPANARP